MCDTPLLDAVVRLADGVCHVFWVGLLLRNSPPMLRMAFKTARGTDFLRFGVFMLALARMGYVVKRLLFGKGVAAMCFAEEFLTFWLILLSIAAAVIIEAVCRRYERSSRV